MSYSGPLPDTEGTYDLSGVIRAATYIDLDFRYGWDGIADGAFDFPVNSTWFVDGRLSRYDGARQDFCAGLAARGFSSGVLRPWHRCVRRGRRPGAEPGLQQRQRLDDRCAQLAEPDRERADGTGDRRDQ